MGLDRAATGKDIRNQKRYNNGRRQVVDEIIAEIKAVFVAQRIPWQDAVQEARLEILGMKEEKPGSKPNSVAQTAGPASTNGHITPEGETSQTPLKSAIPADQEGEHLASSSEQVALEVIDLDALFKAPVQSPPSLAEAAALLKEPTEHALLTSIENLLFELSSACGHFSFIDTMAQMQSMAKNVVSKLDAIAAVIAALQEHRKVQWSRKNLKRLPAKKSALALKKADAVLGEAMNSALKRLAEVIANIRYIRDSCSLDDSTHSYVSYDEVVSLLEARLARFRVQIAAQMGSISKEARRSD